MTKQHRMVKFLVCFVLAAFLMGCAATEKSRSSGQVLDDAAITAKVKTEIIREPTLKALQINVDTYKGVVQLSGFVDSEESVRKAGEVAASVPGVKSVKNNLVVKGSP